MDHAQGYEVRTSTRRYEFTAKSITGLSSLPLKTRPSTTMHFTSSYRKVPIENFNFQREVKKGQWCWYYCDNNVSQYKNHMLVRKGLYFMWNYLHNIHMLAKLLHIKASYYWVALLLQHYYNENLLAISILLHMFSPSILIHCWCF